MNDCNARRADAAEARRKRMYATLAGCEMRKPKKDRHPELARRTTDHSANYGRMLVNKGLVSGGMLYSMCESKTRYPSEGDARSRTHHILRQHPELKLYVYQCSLCGGWHLTHKERNNR